jgi:5-formyltetrahydrofolate cyclo-ligase
MIGDFAEGDGPAEFASPACFIHEVDPSYSGLGATPPELQRSAILRWRKSERQRRIVQRLGISSRDGIRCAGDIAAQLDASRPDLTSIVVSLFWPFRGEPDSGIGRIRFGRAAPFAPFLSSWRKMLR